MKNALTKFVTQVRAKPVSADFGTFISTKQIPYDASKDRHPLRRNTNPVTVEFFSPIVRAVLCYAAKAPNSFIPAAFGLIRTAKGWAIETDVENGRKLVAAYDPNSKKLSASTFNPAVFEDPGTGLTNYPQVSDLEMAALCLLFLPLALEAEASCSAPSLQQDIDKIANISDLQNPTEDEIRSMYHLSVIADIMQTMDVELEQSGTPAAFDMSHAFTGPQVCGIETEKLIHIKTKGMAQKPGVELKMGEAKALYSSYSADRHWTPTELTLIPSFPDDMPVMDEAVKIVKRITQTEHDTNPVVNVMWRGETSYGKSTGVAQAAAILNMPLLRLTCHPAMEAQDFRSTLVPVTEEESVGLDESAIVPKADGDDLVSQALAHYAGLDQDQRRTLLDAESFFQDAMMDSDMAYTELLGSVPENGDSVSVCKLYLDLVSKLRQQPLQEKLAAAKKGDSGNHKPEGPAFRHVQSNYVKAMVNGYMVEIQECSRIRDSGVLVSINEFDRPGSVIPLMTGALAKRHPKAICVMTDNVGYTSCRPVDPSVLRRMGIIIDSYDMPKKKLMDRVKWNTGCKDSVLLKKAYDVWQKVREFTQNNQITEGTVSATELERFVQALMCDGMDAFDEDLDDCIISKATSSLDDQKDIRAAVRALA